jgi:uncharacterized metal-binding protein YceD (DUF177 family)
MTGRREFEIPFVGLKPGIHEYEYQITDKFFTAYQQQDFNNCQATVKVKLDKKTGFILLKFEIGGQLEVICDRCSGNLPLTLWDEFNVAVKLVDDPDVMNEQEEDPDVYYISRGESHISLADWIYEFINLSIPMQKMCEFEDMSGPYCNKSAIEVLKKMKAPDDQQDNPVWKGLEKFKDLDN